MRKRVLLTAGAGFIGSCAADLRLSKGYAVTLLDSLSSQVHPTHERPDYLSTDAELVVGDMRIRRRHPPLRRRHRAGQGTWLRSAG